jgi:hypothetical protein
MNDHSILFAKRDRHRAQAAERLSETRYAFVDHKAQCAICRGKIKSRRHRRNQLGTSPIGSGASALESMASWRI